MCTAQVGTYIDAHYLWLTLQENSGITFTKLQCKIDQIHPSLMKGLARETTAALGVYSDTVESVLQKGVVWFSTLGSPIAQLH